MGVRKIIYTHQNVDESPSTVYYFEGEARVRNFGGDDMFQLDFYDGNNRSLHYTFDANGFLSYIKNHIYVKFYAKTDWKVLKIVEDDQWEFDR